MGESDYSDRTRKYETMKRLKVPDMDSRCISRCTNKKRRRGIKETTSRESTGLARKEKVVDKKDSETSVAVSPSSNQFSEKEGKPVGVLVTGGESSGKEEGRSITRVSSHGLMSVIGRRRVMEDTVRVAIGEIDSHDLFAVYDGHGGTHAANACRDKLHLLIAKEVEEKGRVDCGRRLEYWKDVMTACFTKMDEEVSRGSGDDDMTDAVKSVGSTAVVVIVGKDELVVANCGDSRAVLCRGGVAVPLSSDHKSLIGLTRKRVEAAGGRIINWNGSRVLGVLATSRSIGDQYLKPYVISEPEVTVNERTELDDFLIIASDGLWDVMPNEFACEVVRRCLNGQLRMTFLEECSGSCAAQAATMLTELAFARGSKDNISVIVVELKKPSAIIP